jgi:hypothetical protein
LDADFRKAEMKGEAPAKVALAAMTASSKPGIAFDVSRHPLVVVRLGGAYSSAEWNHMLLDLMKIVERGPFALIADTRDAQLPNALERRAFIDMYEKNDRLTRAHFLVLGVVGDSIRLRGVITALNWLRPAPHPVKVFTTFEMAEVWVLDQLPASLRKHVPPAQPRGG